MNSRPVKVAYIVSQIDKALAFEWISEELDGTRFELVFILLNPGKSILENFLKEKNVKSYRIRYRGKKDMPKSIFQIYRLLKKENVDVVHAHLFDASFAGILAARLAKVRKRIYTRHYSVQHHNYFPRAVKYDRIINKLSTHIIAISNNVKNVLMQKEHVTKDKIHLIHHGFKLDLFDQSVIDPSRVSALQHKYKLSADSPVVGVISRFIHLKGIQYIVPAFKKLLADSPNAVLFLSNASGNYQTEIEKLLAEIPKANYREIKFENDIFALYRLFDVFVHVPIDKESEAFGQTYVEALAAEIPSVFTISGVAGEFIEDGKNATVIPYQDSEALYHAIKIILSDPGRYTTMAMQGKKDVNKLFQLNQMIERLSDLYES